MKDKQVIIVRKVVAGEDYYHIGIKTAAYPHEIELLDSAAFKGLDQLRWFCTALELALTLPVTFYAEATHDGDKPGHICDTKFLVNSRIRIMQAVTAALADPSIDAEVKTKLQAVLDADAAGELGTMVMS